MNASVARAGLAALLALAVAACSGSAAPRSLSPDAIALATSRAGLFNTGCPAARLDGTLVADPETGTAVDSRVGRKPVIWPFGFTARAAAGMVEVLDPAGKVVARTGERVGLSGGEITSDGRWSTCGPPLERS